MQLEVILAGNRIATRVLWSSDSKESIKTKTKSGNCFCIRVRVYKELSVWLIVMSTNLESRERDLERQRKRKNRRQASEAQREKEPQRRRAWAREISATMIKWNRPFRFGPTGMFGASFEGGPLWPVWLFRSVGPKCPFPFDKIAVPRTALCYPACKIACKNNNQTLGGLGRVWVIRTLR